MPKCPYTVNFQHAELLDIDLAEFIRILQVPWNLELHIAQLGKTGTTMSFTCSKTEIAIASAQQYQCRLDPQCTNHFAEQEFVKVLRIFMQ